MRLTEVGHEETDLEQFLGVPDEERDAFIQFFYVFLKITCHHLKHKNIAHKHVMEI